MSAANPPGPMLGAIAGEGLTQGQALAASARIMTRFPKFRARPGFSWLPGDERLGIMLDVGGGDTWWSSEAAAVRYAETFL